MIQARCPRCRKFMIKVLQHGQGSLWYCNYHKKKGYNTPCWKIDRPWKRLNKANKQQ